MLTRRQFELALHLVGLHDKAAVFAVLRPVAHSVQASRRIDPGNRAESVERKRDFVGPHDRSRFIDPNRGRHVDHVVEFGDDVPGVDQRRMRWIAGLDERACRRGAPSVERDRDDREVEILEFFVKRLPPGQVKRASSPRSPRQQKDFLTAIVRQAMQLAVEVGQLEIRSFEGSQRVAAVCLLGAEVPDAIF